MPVFPGMQVPPEVIAAMAKENQSPLIIGIVSAFTALAFVCVLLRFFSRIKFVGIVGLEDYFIAFSMVSTLPVWKMKQDADDVSQVFSIFTSTCLIQTARYGNGKHSLNVPFQNLTLLLKVRESNAVHVKCFLTFSVFIFQHHRLPHRPSHDQAFDSATV